MPLTRKELEAHLTVIETFVAVLRKELLGDPEREAQEPAPRKCPHCGEEDKLERTDEMGGPKRMTCLECGKSWLLPAEEEDLEEVSRG